MEEDDQVDTADPAKTLWTFTVESWFPAFPADLTPEAQQLFNETMQMVHQVVNAPEFESLFLDLCREVAEMYRFTWKPDTTRSDWDDWSHGNRAISRFFSLQVQGRPLDYEYARFVADTRQIELDTSLLEWQVPTPSPPEMTRIKVLLMIKTLRAVAQSLTELVLLYINHLYGEEPYKKRKKLPKKLLPKSRGDCGKSLEKLLTRQNNLVFTYEPKADDVDVVDKIVVVSPTRNFGFRVPQKVVDEIAATPTKFCDLLKTIFDNEDGPSSALEEIPEEIFGQFDFKHGKPQERNSP